MDLFLQEKHLCMLQGKTLLVGGWGEAQGRSLIMFFNYITVVPNAVWALPPIAVRNILQIFKILFLQGRHSPKAACGILVSWPGIEPVFCLEAQSLGHWAREVPIRYLFLVDYVPAYLLHSFLYSFLLW